LQHLPLLKRDVSLEGARQRRCWLHSSSSHQNSLETKSAYPSRASTGGNHTLIEQKIGQREFQTKPLKTQREKQKYKNWSFSKNLNALNKRLVCERG
jgi:hypothetical protein